LSVEIESSGTGAFKGDSTNVVSYSFTEASTPIRPGDDSGGVGEFGVEVREDPRRTQLLYRDNIILKDTLYGEVTGFINSVSSENENARIGGFSRLGSLNTDAVLPPGEGTLGDLLMMIFNRANILDEIDIEPEIAAREIIYPGFTGNLWIYLKNICTAYQIEVSLVLNRVLVRDLRKRELVLDNVSNESWSVEDVTLGRFIDVEYYNYQYAEDILVYPGGGWSPDVSVYQVAANEILILDIQVNGYVTSIKQPTPTDFLPIDYSGPDSLYTVSGNDGLVIPASLWTDLGGSINIELVENGSIIRTTINGANFPPLSPFTIGLSDGSNTYSTLRLIGDGVFYNQQTLRVPTGLTELETSNEVAQTISNPMISTWEEAYNAGVRARSSFASPSRTYSVQGRQLFNPQQSETQVSNTFEDFDDTLTPTPYDFDDFDLSFNGFSFSDVDALNTFFVSQSFGSLSGSRVPHKEAYMRVRQAETTESGVSVVSEFDTLVEDFNDVNDGRSFDDFRIAFYGLTFSDFSLIPLRIRTTHPFFALDDAELGILDVNILA
jgi:hypothetical protein